MSENICTRSPVRMAVFLALHAVCGAIILWLLFRLVPQYEKIFKDFNAKLPDMALIVIYLSKLLDVYWFVLVPGLGAGDFAIMCVLNRTGHTRLMTAWGVVACLAEVLLIGLIVAAVSIPMGNLQ